jgi:hypothetical protein
MLKQFAEIKKGDKIVYYASKNCVVIGIFDVVSDITYLEKDPYWNEIMVYSIRPAEMPPEGYYLDFKSYSFQKPSSLTFSRKKRNGIPTCKEKPVENSQNTTTE